MSEELSGCIWPEQEVVEAWQRKYQVAIPEKAMLELKRAATQHRLEIQRENDSLRSRIAELEALLAAKDKALRKTEARLKRDLSVLRREHEEAMDDAIFFDDNRRLAVAERTSRKIAALKEWLCEIEQASLTPADALKRYEAMERVVEAAKLLFSYDITITYPDGWAHDAKIQLTQALAALEEVEKG